MDIKPFEPLLVIYFKDPSGDESVYTIPLSQKESFLTRLANDKFVEVEETVLKTSYIVKCEPLDSTNPVKYEMLSAPHSIRKQLIQRNRERPFNNLEHLNNFISYLERS